MKITDIHERLLLFRRRLGFTQAEVAADAGVTASVYAAWEQGRVSPRVRDLPNLAKALGVKVSDLIPSKEEVA